MEAYIKARIAEGFTRGMASMLWYQMIEVEANLITDGLEEAVEHDYEHEHGHYWESFHDGLWNEGMEDII